MASFASEISVIINNDSWPPVEEDDGRGIPVEMYADLGFSTLQGVMTVLKFGGKFSKGAYQTSAACTASALPVVNFLSEWCEVEVRARGTSTSRNTSAHDQGPGPPYRTQRSPRHENHL